MAEPSEIEIQERIARALERIAAALEARGLPGLRLVGDADPEADEGEDARQAG